ncbi:MAG: DUF255 domain-containing protein [Planctomycetaceae bacterium]
MDSAGENRISRRDRRVDRAPNRHQRERQGAWSFRRTVRDGFGDRTTTALLTLLVAGLTLLLAGSLPEVDAEADPPPASAQGKANRLARESSPYLLLHAHNPVDWHPWGPEALEKARKEDKPIFLSIGYSSCHWCHVMEREAFSDAEIARYMNEHFVNVKLDREERPDIDEIYMTALQMYFQAIGSSQTGGWPLSIFLTPDGRPLGGGTYFPPKDEPGRTGFLTLMTRVREAWRDNRKQMETNADILANAVRVASRPQPAETPPAIEKSLLKPVLKSLEAGYDPEHGGLGYSPQAPNRPKFPVPTKLALLQYAARQPDGEKLGKLLYHTLDRMAAGGIYDHVGGGFHRYSTDRLWRVPHFEKMLYDNAQLVDLYAEAFRHTGDAQYRAICEGTIEFVSRELTDARGGFYSALDADSEGVEGKYYAWSDEQLSAALSPDERRVCDAVYGTSEKPEFEAGHVLHVSQSLDAAARELKLSVPELERRLSSVRTRLLAARRERPAPVRDDKVLSGWNGLMIRGLARAGVVFERPEYVRAAVRAAEFVLAEMRDEKGRLLHSYRGGETRLTAYLDDYAFLIEGLLALHAATGDDRWANAARRLTDQQLQYFWDDKGKGCYFTANHHEALLARTKNAYDSVMPSGNSVTVRNLVRLATLARDNQLRTRARETLELFAPALEESPAGMTNMALALAEFVDTGDPPAQSAGTRKNRLGIAPDAEIIQAAAEEGPQTPSSKPRRASEIVAVQAYLSTDKLAPGATTRLLVQLDIADGWHIHANPASDPEFDVATELTLSADLGTNLTRLRYPAAKKVPRDEGEPPQLHYVGRVELTGWLETPPSAAGRREELKLQLTYQACTDRKCLSPKTVELVVPVAVAARGERVRPANESLFNPPSKGAKPRSTTERGP